VGVDIWVALVLVPGFSFVDLFFNERVRTAPLRHRFFLGRWLLVLSSADIEVDGEGGGPSKPFWCLSVPAVRK
jgi:hypothetical protein